MSNFDLLDVEKSYKQEAEVSILHPQTNAPTGIKITVLNPDSDGYKKVEAKIRNRSFAALSRNKGKTSAEALEQNAIDLLVGVTTGWTNVQYQQQPLEYSPENVRMLYVQFPFIKEQVDEFVGDRKNFFSA